MKGLEEILEQARAINVNVGIELPPLEEGQEAIGEASDDVKQLFLLRQQLRKALDMAKVNSRYAATHDKAENDIAYNQLAAQETVVSQLLVLVARTETDNWTGYIGIAEGWQIYFAEPVCNCISCTFKRIFES